MKRRHFLRKSLLASGMAVAAKVAGSGRAATTPVVRTVIQQQSSAVAASITGWVGVTVAGVSHYVPTY